MIKQAAGVVPAVSIHRDLRHMEIVSAALAKGRAQKLDWFRRDAPPPKHGIVGHKISMLTIVGRDDEGFYRDVTVTTIPLHATKGWRRADVQKERQRPPSARRLPFKWRNEFADRFVWARK